MSTFYEDSHMRRLAKLAAFMSLIVVFSVLVSRTAVATTVQNAASPSGTPPVMSALGQAQPAAGDSQQSGLKSFFNAVSASLSRTVGAVGPTITKEVVLAEGIVADPISIVRADDGGFLITGSEPGFGHHGHAIRADADGKIKWHYVSSLLDPAWDLSAAPQYFAAVGMPDGDTFLCGALPRHDAGFRSSIAGHEHFYGLITHLDKDGKLIKEQLFKPHGDEQSYGASRFTSCKRSGNGIIAVGTTILRRPNPAAPAGPPFLITFFYWFATFNADGQLQWEKLEPVSNSLVGSPDYMSPLQELDDHGFVLAAASTPLNGPRTEILHIGPNGKIIAETHFDGMFLVLVQPTGQGSAVQLISNTTDSATLITLDGNLRETRRMTKNLTPGLIKAAYRLPDQSLLLFGRDHPPNFSSLYKASVTKLDSDLQNEGHLVMPWTRAAHSLWIVDAAPTATSEEFAAVRVIQRSDGTELAKLGLDFISTK